MDKIKIYSPIQVGVASFVGGPFAAVYVIWQNFRALGKEHAARQTLIFGAAFVVVVLVVLPFLPEKFPNTVIPAAYTIGACMIASQYQMTKAAIVASDRYGFQSGWTVAGISIGFILAFLVVALALILTLDHLGIVTL